MAHLAHYKRSGAAPMLAHYERRAELERGFTRENIDAGRTAQNYAIGAASPQALAAALRARVEGAVREHEQTAGRAVRRDANVLSDWVVTLPRDCPPEDARRFFETAVDVCRARYGAENVLGGFVRMDETTPHVHIPVVPVRDGRLRSAKVFTRTDLQRFHKDLGRAEDAALGRHVSVELGPERQGEKQLSHLGQAEYMAAREEAARATERAAAAEDARRAAEGAQRVAEDRLECLQRGVEDAESLAAAGLGEVRRVAREGQYVGGRESAAQAENRELRARVEALEGEGRELGGRCESLEAEKAGSPAEIQGLERDVRRLGGRVRELRRERCELAGRVRELERDRDGLERRVAGLRGHVQAAWGKLVTRARAFRGWLDVPEGLEWVCRDLARCVDGFRGLGAGRWGSDGRAPRRSRGIAR